MHDMPGTTRDAIDTVVETADGPVRFIDTAGLRRPSKTDRGTEQHSTMRALRALERADVAVLVIDATIGASHQDQRLAERIGVSGCPAIVALNKWDQVPVDDRDDVLAGVGDRLAFLGAAPVLKMSALSGQGCPPHPSGPARLRDGLPPAGAHGGAQPHRAGAPAPPGRSPRTRSATSSRAPSTPRPSRSSRTAGCPRPISATSSAASGRSSTSARRR